VAGMRLRQSRREKKSDGECPANHSACDWLILVDALVSESGAEARQLHPGLPRYFPANSPAAGSDKPRGGGRLRGSGKGFQIAGSKKSGRGSVLQFRLLGFESGLGLVEDGFEGGFVVDREIG